MGYTAELDFFRKLLAGLNISSCIVRDPANNIPSEVDLGLRRELFGAENYAQLLANDMLRSQPNIVYCFVDEFDCKYIFFRLPDEDTPTFFYVGPYLLQMPSGERLRERGRLLGLNAEQQLLLELYYTRLAMPEEENSLLSLCGTLREHIWGGREYSVDYVEYPIPDFYKLLPKHSPVRNVSEPEIDLAALEQLYAGEKALIDAVSKGELHRLTAATAYSAGLHPDDSLRDRKNYLIELKTLLRRAAESGGVHPLHIHRLSEEYSAAIEALRSVKQSVGLQSEMLRSFCLLVRNHSLGKYSYYVGRVITLVRYDLTADLRLKTVAEKLNVNASYLSDLFHREYGCTLTEFVATERISHAIDLLKNTDRPIGQIAAECGIGDLGYFIKRFKQHTGLTPKQYRERFHR